MARAQSNSASEVSIYLVADALLSQLPDGPIAEVRLMNEGRSEEMAVRERMTNARLKHERSMERAQRQFDRLILGGVFLLYAAAIVYGMYASNMAVLAIAASQCQRKVGKARGRG